MSAGDVSQATQSPGGVPGEGSWYVDLEKDHTVVAVVQPSKDIPGESWIARAWDPRLGAFLCAGGHDARDAALGVFEDFIWKRANGNKPRQAITGDSREKRPPRTVETVRPSTERASAAETPGPILEVGLAAAREDRRGAAAGPGTIVDPDDAFGGDDDEDGFG